MGAVLDEIRSGKFAEEWSAQQEDASATLEAVRSARDRMPFAEWERGARTAFGLDEAD